MSNCVKQVNIPIRWIVQTEEVEANFSNLQEAMAVLSAQPGDWSIVCLGRIGDHKMGQFICLRKGTAELGPDPTSLLNPSLDQSEG